MKHLYKTYSVAECKKKKKKKATSSSHFLVHPHLQCDFFFFPHPVKLWNLFLCLLNLDFIM